ncbi:unnamed protein product [Linum trigynum]|uniref:Small EDRK-rich factor-like N-terminal domain-containing protein n=1 Tax=Linum trigynum TaxID=586398 RepID=A0AAV2CEY1_9ROSI
MLRLGCLLGLGIENEELGEVLCSGDLLGEGRACEGLEKYSPIDLSNREKDRERAQSRNPKGGKGKDDGLTPEQRRERDAKALQEKTAKKAAQAAGGESSGGKANAKKKKLGH